MRANLRFDPTRSSELRPPTRTGQPPRYASFVVATVTLAWVVKSGGPLAPEGDDKCCNRPFA